MIKNCGKCNQEFNCRHDEIFECHCIHVPISDKAQKYIKANYKDCLCNKCLKEIAKQFPDNNKTNSSNSE